MANTDGESNQLIFRRILRRLPVYFALALGALALVTLVLAVGIHFGVTGYLTGGWIGFILYTGLLFWIVVRQSRPHWDRWTFWLLMLWLLTIHCFIFLEILRVYPRWRLIWFWPITVLEAGVIGAIFEWIFPARHTRHHGTRKL